MRSAILLALFMASAGCRLRVTPRDDCDLCIREQGGGRDAKIACVQQDRCDDDDR